MSEIVMNEAGTLWFVAVSLVKEEGMEIERHWEHEGYAGALVMQELILKLYPEVEIPSQRTSSEAKEVA